MEVQPEKEPYQHYCFECGVYGVINEISKLCITCVEDWTTKVRAIGAIVL